jgi:hypothetical protein
MQYGSFYKIITNTGRATNAGGSAGDSAGAKADFPGGLESDRTSAFVADHSIRKCSGSCAGRASAIEPAARGDDPGAE